MIKNIIIVFIALVFFTNNAIAHHGTAAHFDHSKDIYVEGVVTEMKFVNPHSYLYFNVADEDGKTVPWRCELVESGTLRRAGLTKEILAPGTVVKVHGKPARREAATCFLENITLTDGTNITHRGVMTDDGEAFTPSSDIAAIDTTASEEVLILATGGSEAKNRKIVDVPIEGMFGHWADGTRRALNPEQATGGQAGGMGGNAMGMGMAMGAGMGMAGGPREASANPEYNDAGLAIVERYDPRYDNPALACSASIVFGMSHHALPNEFVQLSEKELRFTYGFMDMVRTIHVDGEFPAEITPSTSGYSVGKWEDDTLVVTTRGFAAGVLFGTGGDVDGNRATINSDQLELVEQIRHDEATDKLNVTWKATDSGYWTAALEGEKSLTRSIPYEVYGCEELGGKNNVRENGETLFNVPGTSDTKASVTTNMSASSVTAVQPDSALAPTSPEKKSSNFVYIAGGGFLLGILLFVVMGRSKKEG